MNRRGVISLSVMLVGVILLAGTVWALGKAYLRQKPVSNIPSQPGIITPTISPSPGGKITNFDECVAAGNPVTQSYPGQCRANGQVFVEQI